MQWQCRSFAREQHRHRTTYARIPTSDDGYLALEFLAADVIGSFETRFQLKIAFHARLGQVLARHGIDRLLARTGLYRLLPGRFSLRFAVGFLGHSRDRPLPGDRA